MIQDVACFCGEEEAAETELMDVSGHVRAEVAIVDAPASSGTRIIRTMNGEAAEVPANVASELAGAWQHDFKEQQQDADRVPEPDDEEIEAMSTDFYQESEDEDADMGYQEHGDNHSTTERADEEETEEEGEEEEPEQPPPRQARDRGRRGPQPGNATWLPEAWQPPTQH